MGDPKTENRDEDWSPIKPVEILSVDQMMSPTLGLIAQMVRVRVRVRQLEDTHVPPFTWITTRVTHMCGSRSQQARKRLALWERIYSRNIQGTQVSISNFIIQTMGYSKPKPG